MTATFFDAYQAELINVFGNLVNDAPLLFGFIVFLFSLVIMSPAATVAAIMPLGVTLVFLHLILLQFLPVLVVILLYPERIRLVVWRLTELVLPELGALLSTIAIYVLGSSWSFPGLFLPT